MRLRLGVKAADIFRELQSIGGGCAPSRSMVFEWADRFKSGRITVEDDPRSGRPSTAINKESTARVLAVIQEDPHATVKEIAEEVGISDGSCHTILTDHLQYRKVCAAPADCCPERGTSGFGSISTQQTTPLGSSGHQISCHRG